MIGMMMMTFMLFFTFVVNTGMLVNAKINLQNAADLAAYAGAATQARQLNQISYLNYEMRRAYKKFLFRYYIMGNVSQDSFLQGGNGKNAHMWSPNGEAAFNFNVPSVCLTFNPTDNFCHVPTLSKIQIPPSNPTDMINQTLIGQLQALEAIRESNCGDIGQNNTQVLLLWLYNTDPSLQTLLQQSTNATTQGMLAVTQAVSTGLGLVPREIILHQRIKTVQGYVNEDAQSNVQIGTVNAMKQSQDPAASERTIQAFLSAYYTLGQYLYDDQDVSMDEMIPGPSNGGTLLTLNDIKTNFDTYAVGYVSSNPVPGPNGTTLFDCKASLIPIPVQNVPLGVYKDPSALTYYAVRLKARAKIMFSPFGDMDLKAYAAARPFGSRIGPPVATGDVAGQFTRQASPPGQDLLVSTGLAGAVPNLPITVGDSAALGWNTNFALGLYYPALAVGTQTVINGNNATNGYLAAMAPNPYEGNLYNIMSDQNQDQFVRNFDTSHNAAFWAPVFPPGQLANLQSTLSETLNDIYGQGALNVGQVNAQGGATADPQFVTELKSGLNTYMGLLANQQGENGEGMNIVKITDPFHNSAGQPIPLDPQIMLTDPKQIKTSWVTENSSDYTTLGRVGYSVKFVSFDSLSQGQGTSNGNDHWKNFYMDGEGESDGVGQMQH
jgi:Putative Flp pilus-assembly TadE/G-like